MNKIDLDLRSANVNAFNSIYQILNNHILRGKSNSSRNGLTKEDLNWKIELTNPRQRCVGGYDRDVNIFFLLAEALWIWNGRKDVEFLNYFNSNMSNFSDDGESFNAAYGFRLRHWGIPSSNPIKRTEENMHALDLGVDQIKAMVKLLSDSPDSRRAVMSIWNPDFDLSNSKDLPCNDLVMLQIKDSTLHMTISNRSNDLHWGLPTNVFQFSWILELMSMALNVEIGTQTHNSKSLHLYVENEIPMRMSNSINVCNIYDIVQESPIDLKIEANDPLDRLAFIDDTVETMVANIEELINADSNKSRNHITFGSTYLSTVYRILEVFISYKKREVSDISRAKLLSDLEIVKDLSGQYCHDYLILAMNWVIRRVKDKSMKMDLIQQHNLAEQVGKL